MNSCDTLLVLTAALAGSQVRQGACIVWWAGAYYILPPTLYNKLASKLARYNIVVIHRGIYFPKKSHSSSPHPFQNDILFHFIIFTPPPWKYIYKILMREVPLDINCPCNYYSYVSSENI